MKGPGFLQDLYENIESLEPVPESDAKALKALRKVLSDGTDWSEAILKTIASWTCPTEIVNGRRYEYFIAGEAFDWLLLAERLCSEVMMMKNGKIIDKGTCSSLINKHGRKNLEETFLKIVRE